MASRRSLSDDEDAIAVLLPDDLCCPRGAGNHVEGARANAVNAVLCAIEVDPDEISGVRRLRRRPRSRHEPTANVSRVKGMVEKPKVDDAPSPYAAAGRYVLDRAIPMRCGAFRGERVARSS